MIDLGQAAVFLGNGGEALMVGDHVGVGELRFQFAEPGQLVSRIGHMAECSVIGLSAFGEDK